MKRCLCISLCFFVLFSSSLFAKKKRWKHVRRCVPCVPCAPKVHPCVCGLIDVGTFWIGETNPAPGPGCQNPEPIYLPGPNYTYGICQTIGCTGGGCIHVSPIPRPTPPQPIINEPIQYNSNRLFDSKYHQCTKHTPKFIEMEVTKNGGKKETIKVKMFFIEIDFMLIANDYGLKINPKLEDPRLILVGFESTDPPGKEPIYTKKNNNVREAIVEMKDPNGKLKKAIVFLAP